jgi:hypothetical protein
LGLVSLNDHKIYFNNYINYIYIDDIIKNFKKTVYTNPKSIYKNIKETNLNIILSVLKNIESDINTSIGFELYTNLMMLNKQNKKIKNIVIIINTESYW